MSGRNCCSCGPESENLKKSKKINKYLDLAREIVKAMEHAGDDDTNCNWFPWNNPKTFARLNELEIRGRIDTVLLNSESIPRRVHET